MSADFFAGYLSGAVGILVGNPLDILKVRLQAGNATSLTSPSSTTSTATTSAPTKGGHFTNAASLLRGLPAPILTYGALNAILFVSYNRTLTLLDPAWQPGNNDSHTPSAPHLFTAGAVAGLATFVVSAPTELIKCRAQVASSSSSLSSTTSSASASASPSLHSNPELTGKEKVTSWSITKSIYATHGLKGFYHGGAITAARDAIGYGFYFWAYEGLSSAFRSNYASTIPSTTSTSTLDAPRVLLCGGMAGIVTWVSIFPLDVIKTRVQTQPAFLMPYNGAVDEAAVGAGERLLLLQRGRKSEVQGTLSLFRTAYINEGLGVFTRGLGACCVRAFVVNAVQRGVYEWVMSIL